MVLYFEDAECPLSGNLILYWSGFSLLNIFNSQNVFLSDKNFDKSLFVEAAQFLCIPLTSESLI